MTIAAQSFVHHEPKPAIPMGLATLVKLAFEGVSLDPLWETLIRRGLDDPGDAAALMDLSTIAQVTGRRHERLVLQRHALEAQRHYRQLPADGSGDGIRLLAFMVPGDFLANTPVEFLLEGSDVRLDIVYVVPDLPLPDPLPEHDVVLVAATEIEDNRPAMEAIARLVASSRKPVLNAPDRIVRLTREGTWALLHTAPDVAFPINAPIGHADLVAVAGGDTSIEPFLAGSGFPIVIRPVDSHAGEGLSAPNLPIVAV